MRISQEEFNALSIGDILEKLSKVDDLEMHLKGAYETIEEKVEIIIKQMETMESQSKLLDDQLEVIEEYSDRVVALEKLLGGK